MIEIIFICIFYFLSLIFNLADVIAEENPSMSNGKKIYQWYCSPCHCIRGDGKGFNAKNLDPRPANHTDPNLFGRQGRWEINADAAMGRYF